MQVGSRSGTVAVPARQCLSEKAFDLMLRWGTSSEEGCEMGEVTELDSGLLALGLAWLREAREAKRELAFVNLPEALQTLSRLYGVENLLPVKA